MNEHHFYQWQGNDLLLFCQTQPGSAKDEFAGLMQDRLKVRIKAKAIDGKANKALIAFIANAFSCPKTSIELLKGDKQKFKTLRISSPPIIPELGNGLSIAPKAVS